MFMQMKHFLILMTIITKPKINLIRTVEVIYRLLNLRILKVEIKITKIIQEINNNLAKIKVEAFQA
jgi:hypothetical protein